MVIAAQMICNVIFLQHDFPPMPATCASRFEAHIGVLLWSRHLFVDTPPLRTISEQLSYRESMRRLTTGKLLEKLD
jgi:hypothetical protein